MLSRRSSNSPKRHRQSRQAPARGAVLAAGLALASVTPCHAARVLFDFVQGFDSARTPVRGVKISLLKDAEGNWLRVESGHAEAWPGLTLVAPGGHWDLTAFQQVSLDVRNSGASPVTVSCRVDNDGADGVNHCVTANLSLQPGATGVLTVPLDHATFDPAGGKLFGMRGYPGGTGTGKLDPAKVTELLIFVPNPDADHQFDVRSIRAEGNYTTPPEASLKGDFFPFIDTFGQYIHRDWPGKVHSLAELKEHGQAEAQDLAAHPGPAGWDRFGGSADGPKLKATGFFRSEKYEGKWWLVDPDGHLFFSNGIDCVGEMDYTPIAERSTWFQDFPGNQPDMKQFERTAYALHGHYAGQSPLCFCFTGANLERKFGEDWWKSMADEAHRRLRSWGLNTIGNWSDPAIAALDRTPYVATIGYQCKMIEGSSGYWGKFPDVFDPSFQNALAKRLAGEVGKSAGDPFCLGYFVDNEMSWGDDTSLALGALESPPDQAAKVAFIGVLKAKYRTIEKLNAAWGSTYASWDDLQASRTAPDVKRAGEDLRAFYTDIAKKYFKTVRDAVKSVAPNQLYLGCRFAGSNDLAAAAAVKYADVVSYNLYRRSVADFHLPAGLDAPVIIGEFHFGALDRGMFHTGLVPCKTQQDRADSYKSYVEGALRNPAIVGCHWFKYQDEPTTGRVYDEENYQIGFADCADTPYAETIAAARKVGTEMYSLRNGK